MKLRSFVANTLSAITALGFFATAQAQTFSGNSDAMWEDPFPGVFNKNPFYFVEKSAKGNKFSWGDESIFETGPNSISFVGSKVNNVGIGSLFEVGKLEYFNGSILSLDPDL